MNIFSTFFIILLLLKSGIAVPLQNVEEDSNIQKNKRILILGNSITKHGPSPQLQWSGNWGMAASSQDKDYVHLLIKKIKERGYNDQIFYENFSFEREFWKLNPSMLIPFKKDSADIIILEFGENVSPADAKKYNYGLYLEKLANYLKTSDSTMVCLLSDYWPNDIIDSCIRQTAEKNNWLYIPIGDLSNEEYTAKGKFLNEGVSRHPSDKGMAAIADRIWTHIEVFLKK
jgi:lysophospholipase L1-like esterase